MNVEVLVLGLLGSLSAKVALQSLGDQLFAETPGFLSSSAV